MVATLRGGARYSATAKSAQTIRRTADVLTFAERSEAAKRGALTLSAGERSARTRRGWLKRKRAMPKPPLTAWPPGTAPSLAPWATALTKPNWTSADLPLTGNYLANGGSLGPHGNVAARDAVVDELRKAVAADPNGDLIVDSASLMTGQPGDAFFGAVFEGLKSSAAGNDPANIWQDMIGAAGLAAIDQNNWVIRGNRPAPLVSLADDNALYTTLLNSTGGPLLANQLIANYFPLGTRLTPDEMADRLNKSIDFFQARYYMTPTEAANTKAAVDVWLAKAPGPRAAHTPSLAAQIPGANQGTGGLPAGITPLAGQNLYGPGAAPAGTVLTPTEIKARENYIQALRHDATWQTGGPNDSSVFGMSTPAQQAQRQALENQLIDTIFAEAKARGVQRRPKGQRRLLVTGGPVGAGKSTALVQYEKQLGGPFLVVNVDDITDRMIALGMVPTMPGLSPAESVHLARNEADRMRTAVYARALREGYDTAFDTTMGYAPYIQARIAEAKQAGYTDPQAMFVNIPTAMSVKSAEDRWVAGVQDWMINGVYSPVDGGRFISPNVPRRNVAKVDTSLPSGSAESFLNLARAGTFDKVLVIDNSNNYSGQTNVIPSDVTVSDKTLNAVWVKNPTTWDQKVNNAVIEGEQARRKSGASNYGQGLASPQPTVTPTPAAPSPSNAPAPVTPAVTTPVAGGPYVQSASSTQGTLALTSLTYQMDARFQQFSSASKFAGTGGNQTRGNQTQKRIATTLQKVAAQSGLPNVGALTGAQIDAVLAEWDRANKARPVSGQTDMVFKHWLYNTSKSATALGAAVPSSTPNVPSTTVHPTAATPPQPSTGFSGLPSGAGGTFQFASLVGDSRWKALGSTERLAVQNDMRDMSSAVTNAEADAYLNTYVNSGAGQLGRRQAARVAVNGPRSNPIVWTQIIGGAATALTGAATAKPPAITAPSAPSIVVNALAAGHGANTVVTLAQIQADPRFLALSQSLVNYLQGDESGGMGSQSYTGPWTAQEADGYLNQMYFPQPGVVGVNATVAGARNWVTTLRAAASTQAPGSTPGAALAPAAGYQSLNGLKADPRYGQFAYNVQGMVDNDFLNGQPGANISGPWSQAEAEAYLNALAAPPPLAGITSIQQARLALQAVRSPSTSSAVLSNVPGGWVPGTSMPANAPTTSSIALYWSNSNLVMQNPIVASALLPNADFRNLTTNDQTAAVGVLQREAQNYGPYTAGEVDQFLNDIATQPHGSRWTIATQNLNGSAQARQKGQPAPTLSTAGPAPAAVPVGAGWLATNKGGATGIFNSAGSAHFLDPAYQNLKNRNVSHLADYDLSYADKALTTNGGAHRLNNEMVDAYLVAFAAQMGGTNNSPRGAGQEALDKVAVAYGYPKVFGGTPANPRTDITNTTVPTPVASTPTPQTPLSWGLSKRHGGAALLKHRSFSLDPRYMALGPNQQGLADSDIRHAMAGAGGITNAMADAYLDEWEDFRRNGTSNPRLRAQDAMNQAYLLPAYGGHPGATLLPFTMPPGSPTVTLNPTGYPSVPGVSAPAAPAAPTPPAPGVPTINGTPLDPTWKNWLNSNLPQYTYFALNSTTANDPRLKVLPAAAQADVLADLGDIEKAQIAYYGEVDRYMDTYVSAYAQRPAAARYLARQAFENNTGQTKWSNPLPAGATTALNGWASVALGGPNAPFDTNQTSSDPRYSAWNYTLQRMADSAVYEAQRNMRKGEFTNALYDTYMDTATAEQAKQVGNSYSTRDRIDNEARIAVNKAYLAANPTAVAPYPEAGGQAAGPNDTGWLGATFGKQRELSMLNLTNDPRYNSLSASDRLDVDRDLNIIRQSYTSNNQAGDAYLDAYMAAKAAGSTNVLLDTRRAYNAWYKQNGSSYGGGTPIFPVPGPHAGYVQQTHPTPLGITDFPALVQGHPGFQPGPGETLTSRSGQYNTSYQSVQNQQIAKLQYASRFLKRPLTADEVDAYLNAYTDPSVSNYAAQGYANRALQAALPDSDKSAAGVAPQASMVNNLGPNVTITPGQVRADPRTKQAAMFGDKRYSTAFSHKIVNDLVDKRWKDIPTTDEADAYLDYVDRWIGENRARTLNNKTQDEVLAGARNEIAMLRVGKKVKDVYGTRDPHRVGAANVTPGPPKAKFTGTKGIAAGVPSLTLAQIQADPRYQYLATNTQGVLDSDFNAGANGRFGGPWTPEEADAYLDAAANAAFYDKAQGLVTNQNRNGRNIEGRRAFDVARAKRNLEVATGGAGAAPLPARYIPPPPPKPPKAVGAPTVPAVLNLPSSVQGLHDSWASDPRAAFMYQGPPDKHGNATYTPAANNAYGRTARAIDRIGASLGLTSTADLDEANDIALSRYVKEWNDQVAVGEPPDQMDKKKVSKWLYTVRTLALADVYDQMSLDQRTDVTVPPDLAKTMSTEGYYITAANRVKAQNAISPLQRIGRPSGAPLGTGAAAGAGTTSTTTATTAAPAPQVLAAHPKPGQWPTPSNPVDFGGVEGQLETMQPILKSDGSPDWAALQARRQKWIDSVPGATQTTRQELADAVDRIKNHAGQAIKPAGYAPSGGFEGIREGAYTLTGIAYPRLNSATYSGVVSQQDLKDARILMEAAAQSDFVPDRDGSGEHKMYRGLLLTDYALAHYKVGQVIDEPIGQYTTKRDFAKAYMDLRKKSMAVGGRDNNVMIQVEDAHGLVSDPLAYTPQSANHALTDEIIASGQYVVESITKTNEPMVGFNYSSGVTPTGTTEPITVIKVRQVSPGYDFSAGQVYLLGSPKPKSLAHAGGITVAPGGSLSTIPPTGKIILDVGRRRRTITPPSQIGTHVAPKTPKGLVDLSDPASRGVTLTSEPKSFAAGTTRSVLAPPSIATNQSFIDQGTRHIPKRGATPVNTTFPDVDAYWKTGGRSAPGSQVAQDLLGSLQASATQGGIFADLDQAANDVGLKPENAPGHKVTDEDIAFYATMQRAYNDGDTWDVARKKAVYEAYHVAGQYHGDLIHPSRGASPIQDTAHKTWIEGLMNLDELVGANFADQYIQLGNQTGTPGQAGNESAYDRAARTTDGLELTGVITPAQGTAIRTYLAAGMTKPTPGPSHNAVSLAPSAQHLRSTYKSSSNIPPLPNVPVPPAVFTTITPTIATGSIIKKTYGGYVQPKMDVDYTTPEAIAAGVPQDTTLLSLYYGALNDSEKSSIDKNFGWSSYYFTNSVDPQDIAEKTAVVQAYIAARAENDNLPLKAGALTKGRNAAKKAKAAAAADMQARLTILKANGNAKRAADAAAAAALAGVVAPVVTNIPAGRPARANYDLLTDVQSPRADEDPNVMRGPRYTFGDYLGFVRDPVVQEQLATGKWGDGDPVVDEAGMNDYVKSGNINGMGQAHGDKVMQLLATVQGYTDQPDIVTSDEMDEYIQNGEWAVYRGLQDQSAVPSTIKGTFSYSSGAGLGNGIVYGRGTYWWSGEQGDSSAAANRQSAYSSSAGYQYHVRATFRPDAHIARRKDFVNMINIVRADSTLKPEEKRFLIGSDAWHKASDGTMTSPLSEDQIFDSYSGGDGYNLNGTWTDDGNGGFIETGFDPAVLSTAFGYDAYFSTEPGGGGRNILTILNRTALRLQATESTGP